MITIGIISGEILELFEEVKKPLTVREIEVYLGQSKGDILMSLGWLIREGFIATEYVGENTFFRLKEAGRQRTRIRRILKQKGGAIMDDKKVKDPVCGMEIEKGEITSEFNTLTYYFCSEECKKKFDEFPRKYVSCCD